MIRRCIVWLARPKGPLGRRPGGPLEVTVPFRSEPAMIRLAKANKFNSSIRARFMKGSVKNGLHAIPRDLGQLPRDYAVKILFLNQPIRLLDLWELCKQKDDVPLDSLKHLRQVLKIAKLQKWVYVEKNQTNNMWYYYLAQNRTPEVQEMLRTDATLQKEAEAKAAEDAASQKVVDEELAAVRLDDTILALQNALIANVSRLNEFDPEYVRQLPYVTDSGAVNVGWHFSDKDGGGSEERREGEERGAESAP